MDVFLIFFVIGFFGGGSAVGLAWIMWWRWENRQPIHCWGCRCSD